MSVDDGVGCIVLAAGSSRRFGSDKRQHRLPSGNTLLQETLATLEALFSRRIVVLRPSDTALADQLRGRWQTVLAPDASLGMGHSLAAGIAAASGWTGAVVALADMPWVQASTYMALRKALTPASLVVPHYQGQRGNPVGIGSGFFAALEEPAGDRGARHLFAAHPANVVVMEVNDPGVLRDLDTPD